MTPAAYISEQLEEMDYLEEGIAFAQKRMEELKKDNLFLLELLNQSMFLLIDQLSSKQREIFLISYKLLENKFLSLNKLSEIISNRLDLSFSTTKWNLTKLRDIGFFETIGSRGNTKTTLISTTLGKTFYSFLAHSSNKKL